MSTRPGTAKTRINRETTGPRIDQKPTSGAEQLGPIERMVAFHTEIRAAAAALTALVKAATRAPVDGDKARRLVAFLKGPLLLHDEDEEVGLLPRLRRVGLTDAELAVIEATSRRHDRMEELLEQLAPVLAGLAAGTPDEPSDLVEAVGEARALEVLLDGLMDIEEVAIYPLARARLSAEELEELGREMTARHGDTHKRSRRAVEL